MTTEKPRLLAGMVPDPPLPPPPSVTIDPALPVPDDRLCEEYWQRFEMLDNIAAHSRRVAQVATFVARHAKERGITVDVPTVRASALLHDIAKTYCIRHGGNHSQLGGAWAMELTSNPAIATGITHHVYWPFELDVAKYITPLAVIYADKRIRHDKLVTIRSRFEDLIERYGTNDYIRGRIELTRAQALDLEDRLSKTIEVDLNACDFDSGRLV